MSLYNNDAVKEMSLSVPTGMGGYKKAEAEAYVRKLITGYQDTIAQMKAEVESAKAEAEKAKADAGKIDNSVDATNLKIKLDKAIMVIKEQQKKMLEQDSAYKELLEKKVQEQKEAGSIELKKADIVHSNEVRRLQADLAEANAKCENYETKIDEYEREGGVLAGFYTQVKELNDKLAIQGHKLESDEQYIDSLRNKNSINEKTCAEYKEKYEIQSKLCDKLSEENAANKESIRLLQEEIERIYKDKLELIATLGRGE